MVEENLLTDIRNRLVRGLHPDKIILFGSQARGDADRDSDVDLFVVVPHSTLSPARRATEARRNLRGLSVAVDILVRTRDEFKCYRGVRTSLEWDVDHNGIVLYG